MPTDINGATCTTEDRQDKVYFELFCLFGLCIWSAFMDEPGDKADEREAHDHYIAAGIKVVGMIEWHLELDAWFGANF